MAVTDYYSSITIERRSGSAIEGTLTEGVLAGEWEGFIQPVSASEQFKFGKSGENATHRLYTHIDTDIQRLDKVTQNGQSYTVLAFVQPAGVSGVDSHREILLGIYE